MICYGYVQRMDNARLHKGAMVCILWERHKRRTPRRRWHRGTAYAIESRGRLPGLKIVKNGVLEPEDEESNFNQEVVTIKFIENGRNNYQSNEIGLTFFKCY